MNEPFLVRYRGEKEIIILEGGLGIRSALSSLSCLVGLQMTKSSLLWDWSSS